MAGTYFDTIGLAKPNMQIIENTKTVTCSDPEHLCVIQQPVYKWQFQYTKNDNMIYNKEKAPCYFHRLMQKLILGVEWRRIKK